MAYKRQIDRLPIVPKDAKEFNVTCHYCIVGCGYKAYTWPTNKQGGTAPGQNKFGVDLAKQQPAVPARGTRPRCTTSSGRTAKMFTSSLSRTRNAW
jgi:Fe-S-cluster-containing dehydrogenase component